MIGIDTNVLVRATVRDDDAQAQRADAFLETLTREKPDYVTHIVLVELWWVLTRAYKYAPRQALDVIEPSSTPRHSLRKTQNWSPMLRPPCRNAAQTSRTPLSSQYPSATNARWFGLSTPKPSNTPG